MCYDETNAFNITIILFRWAKIANLIIDQAFFTFQSTFIYYLQFISFFIILYFQILSFLDMSTH